MAGQQITSADGRHHLILQADGNVVTYAGTRALRDGGTWREGRLRCLTSLVVERPGF